MPKPTLPEQRALLTTARTTLTTTHLGLEPVIDRVLAAVAPWLLMPETQVRPRVLGLWGMTGTGKSSLVRALVRALGMEDRTFWLDAGECRNNFWLDGHLDLMRLHHDGAPFMLMVDEFQHARTVKAGVEQDEPKELRRLWELIDTGTAQVATCYRELENLLDLHADVQDMLAEEVEVRAGRVVRGKPTYRRIMADHLDRHAKNEDRAIPRNCWNMLRTQMNRTLSMNGLQQALARLDGPGTLRFLEERIAEQRVPTVLDARKALVVVLGNLDRLYVAGREPIAEIDADVLFARHAEVGSSGVQEALLDLFRIEQVARLGTDHIVFPPMDARTVSALVRSGVEALGASCSTTLGKSITISDAVLERIQQEASIAVLGARPIVEAVQNVVPALLGQVMLHPWSDRAERIHLHCTDERTTATLGFAKGEREMALRWPGVRLAGRSVAPEQLYRYAVHEAGHVLCGLRLLGLVPLQACVRKNHAEVGGFVIWDTDDQPMTRALIVPHLAKHLGGWAAEHLVYGPDAVSAGSQEDLRKATGSALALVKTYGLGNTLLHHAEHPESHGGGFRTTLEECEAEARTWMEAARALAMDTLRKERATLESFAAELTERGSMGRSAIEAFLSERITRPRAKRSSATVIRAIGSGTPAERDHCHF